ncbi:MAG: hypothetical protein FWC41_05120 [Firmicutes bacterium]|nr:hypothetical protein [Bacillota bacterium]
MLSFGNKNFDKKLASLLAVVAAFANIGSSVNATKTGEGSSTGNTKISVKQQKKTSLELSENAKRGLAFLGGVVAGSAILGIGKFISILSSSSEFISPDAKYGMFIQLFMWHKPKFLINEHIYATIPFSYRVYVLLAIKFFSDPVSQILFADTAENRESCCLSLYDGAARFFIDAKDVKEKDEIRGKLDQLCGFIKKEVAKSGGSGGNEEKYYDSKNGSEIDDINDKCEQILNDNINKLFEGKYGQKNVDVLTKFIASLLADTGIGKANLGAKFVNNNHDNVENVKKIRLKFTEAAGTSIQDKLTLLATIKASITSQGKKILMLSDVEPSEDDKEVKDKVAPKVAPKEKINLIKTFKEKIILDTGSESSKISVAEYEAFANAILNLDLKKFCSIYHIEKEKPALPLT